MILSNCLVQYPIVLAGIPTTWGAFSYPLIFVITDLTTLVFGSARARLVIFCSVLPSFFASYAITNLLNHDRYFLWGLPELPLRIAIASASAYSVGQLLDSYLFSHFRRQRAWWLAPLLASGTGNGIDTLLFFSIAFYQCHDPYLNQYWPQIAVVDLGVKFLVTLLAIVPLYGILLTALTRQSLKGMPAWP